MSVHGLLSDQLYMWSDPNDRGICCCPQTAPQATAAQSAPPGVHPSGLAHRALQALWQSGLPMCRGSRTRPQVLPLRELPRQISTDGLRPPGRLRRGKRARSRLPSDPRDPRRDLRDQPRTAAASRGALRGGGEPSFNLVHHPHRFPVWRRAPRQHARGLVRRRARLAAADRGGRR